MLGRTSTDWAPWYMVPSDRKWVRNLVVAGIIAKTLKSLDLKYPKPAVDLKNFRRELRHDFEARGRGKKRREGR
jgi:hypothetical protein